MKDLTGLPYDQLTVQHYAYAKKGRAYWFCTCKCGGSKTVCGKDLRRGNTRSCGCLVTKHATSMNSSHGDSRSPEYQTWCRIKNRCYNPNYKQYHDYGGRGITVCDHWRDSYENFLADMGRRPSTKHTIERDDNDSHYTSNNCRWAPARNRSGINAAPSGS